MKLTDTQVLQQLQELDGWKFHSSALMKLLVFQDFSATVSFVNKIVPVANGMNHHPDLRIYGWNKLEVSITTHDTGGLTALDFELAHKIDHLLKGITDV